MQTDTTLGTSRNNLRNKLHFNDKRRTMNSEETQPLRNIFNTEKADKDAVFVFDLDCALVDTRPLYEQMRVNAANLLMEHTGLTYDEAMDATWDALNDYNGYVREAFHDRYGIDKTVTTHAVYNPETMDMSTLSIPDHIFDMLEDIEGRVFLYTNSTSEYAFAMLEALGIDQYFDGIYGTDSLGYTRKPDKEALQAFMDKAQAKAENIWFFEDSIENLKAAKEMGWHTILVTEFMEGNLHKKERQELSISVDRILQSLSELTKDDIRDQTVKSNATKQRRNP